MNAREFLDWVETDIGEGRKTYAELKESIASFMEELQHSRSLSRGIGEIQEDLDCMTAERDAAQRTVGEVAAVLGAPAGESGSALVNHARTASSWIATAATAHHEIAKALGSQSLEPHELAKSALVASRRLRAAEETRINHRRAISALAQVSKVSGDAIHEALICGATPHGSDSDDGGAA